MLSSIIQRERSVGEQNLPWDKGFTDFETEIALYLRHEILTPGKSKESDELLKTIGTGRIPLILAFMVNNSHTRVRGIPLLERYDKKQKRLPFCEVEHIARIDMSEVSAFASQVAEDKSSSWLSHDSNVVLVEANLGENRLQFPVAVGHFNPKFIDNLQYTWISQEKQRVNTSESE
jgi:hypothetical protein